MGLNEDLVSLFHENRGRFLSGEELAGKLAVVLGDECQDRGHELRKPFPLASVKRDGHTLEPIHTKGLFLLADLAVELVLVFESLDLGKCFIGTSHIELLSLECVKNKVPFVLAGSIRDDGPLPDVITDVVQAQREYKKVLKDASMVIMISTMLHSIATGNMLPANVKVIVVDISQPTVTKLMDRGTWQALGIVSDVGAFLPMVAAQIKKKK